ncbi:TPA: ribosome recycling factor [bacterium]|jgi:ribosome recycling factor|nr:ribosome recycling factor [bacterium]
MSTQIIDRIKERMSKTIDTLHKDFSVIRTGRANPQILDRIMVDYYGFMTPLVELAQITTPEPRQIMIKPYDKEGLKAIEKAIIASNIGLMPTNDGTVIRLNIPPLTEERRKELAKVVGKTAESAKVAIRNIRRDANDTIKKDKSIPEDERKRIEKDIQKTTDEFIKKVDEAAKEKEAEIMSV